QPRQALQEAGIRPLRASLTVSSSLSEVRTMSPLMDRSFEGKVAVVTGAASGMGLVTARSFAEAGAAVALADIDERAARTAVDDLIGAGHRAVAVRCNAAGAPEGAAQAAQTD